jgi:flagellar M-ring protein FliF
MKQAAARLLNELRNASGTTKAVLLAACGLLAVVAAFATYNATTPHFVLLYSELDAAACAKIQAALAGAGIRFRVSQPPGPFVVHVDESHEYAAKNAVALSDALAPRPYGIVTDSGGASSVFMTAAEREQASMKRAWQEMERQLEELSFVSRATVTTSMPAASAFRARDPLTVSVALILKNGAELSRLQAETVAKLVRFRFGVPSENVVIADQNARTVFDGTDEESSFSATDLIDQKLRDEREREDKANRLLEQMFGPENATVTVQTEWTYVEVERVSETLDPENKVVVSQTKSSSKTPSGADPDVGGAAGMNVDPASQAPATPAPASKSEVASTQDETKTTRVGSRTEHLVDRTPKLERLSVSLVVDESLASKLAGLESIVKDAVGFDAERGDSFSSYAHPFAGIPRDSDGKVLPSSETPPPAPLNPALELLLERGVEIVTALAFVVLLLRALKRAGSAEKKAASKGAAVAERVDPEALAKAKIDELLASEPERVGEILSRWVEEELEIGTGARR